MSGLDGLQLDADGYLDMDQYPDDGTDLADAELAQLRDALHADPVAEPTAEEWDAMFDDVITSDDSGPFAVDAGAEGEYDVPESSASDTDDVVDPTDADDLAADQDLSDDLVADAGDLADTTVDDLDLDADLDGGLDLAPVDEIDDVFTPEALDDAPAEVANNDFEDLL